MHITFLKSFISPAQGKSLPTVSGETFAAVFVLIYRLREFPLSTVSISIEVSIKATVAIVSQNLPLLNKYGRIDNKPLVITVSQPKQ